MWANLNKRVKPEWFSPWGKKLAVVVAAAAAVVFTASKYPCLAIFYFDVQRLREKNFLFRPKAAPPTPKSQIPRPTRFHPKPLPLKPGQQGPPQGPVSC